MPKIDIVKGQAYIVLADGSTFCDSEGTPLAMTEQEARDRLFTGNYDPPEPKKQEPVPASPRTRRKTASDSKRQARGAK